MPTSRRRKEKSHYKKTEKKGMETEYLQMVDFRNCPMDLVMPRTSKSHRNNFREPKNLGQAQERTRVNI